VDISFDNLATVINIVRNRHLGTWNIDWDENAFVIQKSVSSIDGAAEIIIDPYNLANAVDSGGNGPRSSRKWYVDREKQARIPKKTVKLATVTISIIANDLTIIVNPDGFS